MATHFMRENFIQFMAIDQEFYYFMYKIQESTNIRTQFVFCQFFYLCFKTVSKFIL